MGSLVWAFAVSKHRRQISHIEAQMRLRPRVVTPEKGTTQKQIQIHINGFPWLITVNSEIFARVLFSRNFVSCQKKNFVIGKITLLFTDII